MPTYEYKWPYCKWTKEVNHSISQKLSIICEKCVVPDVMVRGVGGGIGVHFKGSGFYETDYKGK